MKTPKPTSAPGRIDGVSGENYSGLGMRRLHQQTSWLFTSEEGREADLDKARHGIHYMLTQSAWDGDEALDFLVGGGAQVGDLEVGYGPARAFSSDQVQSLHVALEPLDAEVLRARFNPATR